MYIFLQNSSMRKGKSKIYSKKFFSVIESTLSYVVAFEAKIKNTQKFHAISKKCWKNSPFHGKLSVLDSSTESYNVTQQKCDSNIEFHYISKYRKGIWKYDP